MLLGAHFAGMAIEQSMLGAAHACANPLTARYDIAHGLALAIVLPHVVRWNAAAAKDRYAALLGAAAAPRPRRGPAETLAVRLEDFAVAGHLAITLSDAGVDAAAIPELAELAAQQWTGTFNPRPFDARGRRRDLSGGHVARAGCYGLRATCTCAMCHVRCYVLRAVRCAVLRA